MIFNTTFFASGSKGNEVRADGNGSYLARGFYFQREGGSFAGPFRSETQADLIRAIEITRRLHESELSRSELAALRSLRKQGVVSNIGLYLTASAVA